MRKSIIHYAGSPEKSRTLCGERVVPDETYKPGNYYIPRSRTTANEREVTCRNCRRHGVPRDFKGYELPLEWKLTEQDIGTKVVVRARLEKQRSGMTRMRHRMDLPTPIVAYISGWKSLAMNWTVEHDYEGTTTRVQDRERVILVKLEVRGNEIEVLPKDLRVIVGDQISDAWAGFIRKGMLWFVNHALQPFGWRLDVHWIPLPDGERMVSYLIPVRVKIPLANIDQRAMLDNIANDYLSETSPDTWKQFLGFPPGLFSRIFSTQWGEEEEEE